MRGIITLVQEHRFQLEDEAGGHRLFILAHNAPLEWSDLKQLERGHYPVAVAYSKAPHMLALTAHDVQQLEHRSSTGKIIQ